MTEFEQLLRTPGSTLGLLLRASLTGLGETLRTAHRLCGASDPGADACARLVTALARLVEADVAVANPPGSPATAPPATTASSSEFGLVLDRLLANPQTREELGTLTVPTLPAGERWRWANLLLLRLSRDCAIRYRRELLAAAGPQADTRSGLELPWETNEPLLPGWVGPPAVAGVRLAQRAPLDSRLRPPPYGPVATELARIVSILLWLTDNDLDLQHGYRDLFRFGLTPLTVSQQSAYQTALADRFHRFADAEQGDSPVQALRKWLDLDEAIHSAAYAPLPAYGSWWGRLLQKTRGTVEPVRERAVAAGHRVILREPTGEYSSALELAGESDVEVSGPVPAGHVSRCVRMYLRVDAEVIRGRVFYRPL